MSMQLVQLVSKYCVENVLIYGQKVHDYWVLSSKFYKFASQWLDKHQWLLSTTCRVIKYIARINIVLALMKQEFLVELTLNTP